MHFSASWQRQVSRVKGLTAAEVRDRIPTDPSLVCPIDNKLFRDAVKTPCCETIYCEECIQTHLLERDFICPNCSKKIASLDKLIVDKPTRVRVSHYTEKAIEESRREWKEGEFSMNEEGQVCPFLLQKSLTIAYNNTCSRHQRLSKAVLNKTYLNRPGSTWTCNK